MDFNKLTIKAQEAVAAAQELARRFGNPELYPEHLLLALLDQELPRELVPDPEALRAHAEATLACPGQGRRRGEAHAGRLRVDRASAARARRRPARPAGSEDQGGARRPA